MLQHGRMEIVRKLANVACEPERLLLKLREFLLQLLTDVILAQPLPETTEGDRDTSQLLADVVVQVARDPRSLDLLSPNQPAGQILNLLMTRLQFGLARASPIFGVLSFGDVDVAADIARKTAVSQVPRNAGRQQPSVATVGVAKAVLRAKRPACVDCGDVDADAAIKVVGMDGIQPAVVEQLLEWQTRKSRASEIQEVQRRVWSHRPHHGGCLFHDEPKALLTFAQRALGAAAARALDQ